MRRRHWYSALAASSLAMGLLVAQVGVASAQMRDFSGRIQKVSADKLVVDNRSGDMLTFVPADGVAVRGGKSSWAALAKKDWVTVSWKIGDEPRKAYRVVVLPPRKDD